MIEVFTCDQGTEEWLRARAGIPTASEFATLLMKGRGGEPSKTRRTYLLKLAGEILTGELMDSFSTVHTERGHALEPEARDLYAFQQDVEPECVGFIRNGQKGCSPDSLIGTDGMLEIKTKLPYLTLECLISGEFPADHKAQCQGALWVAEREWIDLMVYWPKLPPFIKRAYRDEAYIKTLSEAVDAFNFELEQTVKYIRRYGEIGKEAAE